VLDVKDLRKLILSEAHDTAYSIHLGSMKMYYDLKERFWWYGMKHSVAEYVAICDTCCGRTNLNYTGSSTRVHS
jgi:hypothetical protein